MLNENKIWYYMKINITSNFHVFLKNLKSRTTSLFLHATTQIILFSCIGQILHCVPRAYFRRISKGEESRMEGNVKKVYEKLQKKGKIKRETERD